MKKIFSIYKRDMLRAAGYKAFRRAVVSACLCLVWDRFLSDGVYTVWQAPCLAIGAVLLGWAWVNYLRLDGIRLPFVDRARSLSDERTARRHGTHSIADFADEKIVSYDELSDEERVLCSLLACLAVGLPMTAAGLIAGFV